ncbi:LADA_0H01244g1_1 [Lachancea dasiensis]|uniref:LADA_0H01244g1_1 n=1 Tax=Lachancea dasiensis TaxID=1072105 RepID=A0A1G4JZE5_9SACH|nr:LADA_0H01244g1_1 [Lachancea dasiensis]
MLDATDMGTEAGAPESIKKEELLEWGVDEVLTWCEQKLAIDEKELPQIRERFYQNAIDGPSVLELDLDDCKQLLNEDAQLAVKLKLEINRLKHQEHSQEEDVLTILNQLYSTVSEKLQDFQGQYSRLRLDVLEVVKKDSYTSQIQNTQSSSAPLQGNSHQPQHDYFEGHRVVTPGSPNNTIAMRQPLNRSTSSATSQHFSVTNNASTPAALPNTQASSGAGAPSGVSTEPLKHMRASKEDSCERVLKSAMKRHGLSEQDWRQYVLVICYGDQERMLELEEKPVHVFKALKEQGLHPAIMLRQRGDFEEVNGGLTPGGRL